MPANIDNHVFKYPRVPLRPPVRSLPIPVRKAARAFFTPFDVCANALPVPSPVLKMYRASAYSITTVGCVSDETVESICASTSELIEPLLYQRRAIRRHGNSLSEYELWVLVELVQGRGHNF